MVGIEDRAIGGAQPPKPVAELFALEFEQPFLTGGQRRTRGGVDDARRDISMNPADRNALFGPMPAEIIDRPAGDRARNSGRMAERRVGKDGVSTWRCTWEACQ